VGTHIERFSARDAFVRHRQHLCAQAEQRRHADAIKKLERGLIKVGLEQDTLTLQADQAGSTLSDRFGQIEKQIAAMESKVQANESYAWWEPVGELAVAGVQTRADIHGLRSSLDEHVQAYRKEIAAITARLDAVEQANQSTRIDALVQRLERLEQLVSRDLTSSIRPPARKKVVKRKARTVRAARAEGQSYLPVRPRHYQFSAGPVDIR
jgi:acetolactate synthase small subunit